MPNLREKEVLMGSVCHIANLVGGGVESADFRVCKSVQHHMFK